MHHFHHFGVPVKTKQENEIYREGPKVFATDPEDHPFRIEFLRFDKDSPVHEDVLNNPHLAFMVDDLNAALEGKNVIVEPFNVDETLRLAFINENGAIIELMQEI
jgi:hypothetical protein